MTQFPLYQQNSRTTYLWMTSCCLLSHSQESSFSDDENKHGFFHPHHHVVIPWYFITAAGSYPPDLKFHTIKKDVPYRLWNTVSNGLIQRDPHNPMVITCSGGFDDNNSEKHDLRNKIINGHPTLLDSFSRTL